MLYGEFQHTLDAKGRLIIPSKFREKLGDTFILAKGLDTYLYGFPFPEWEKLVTKLEELPFNDEEYASFSRFLFSGASECEIDKQGRILIPPIHREYAKFDKDVAVIGVGNRMEIWDKNTWQNYNRVDFIKSTASPKVAEFLSKNRYM